MITAYDSRPLEARPKGFVLLYAVMTASIILAVGVSIISIALKQLSIANLGRESQYAFYAANTGAECALYWDFHGVLGSTGAAGTYRRLAVFRSPFNGSWPEVSGGDAASVTCAGTALMASPGTFDGGNGVGADGHVNNFWTETHSATLDTTAFTVFLERETDGTPKWDGSCARVTVEKLRGTGAAGGAFTADASGSNLQTTIDSRGYNYCGETNSRRVERGLKFTY